VGLGAGVAVETRVGVDAGVSLGVGAGVGVWANDNAAAKNALMPRPPTRNCLGIQNGSVEG